MTEKIEELIIEQLFKLSDKKYTITPCFNKYSVYLILSTVFLENLEISFVNIKSIFPKVASSIIFKKESRFLTAVPLIPSSI